MAMKSAILPALFCILLAPAKAVAVDGAGEETTRRSLDLSLPSDALDETWSPPSAGTGNATPLPDLGGARVGNATPARRGGGYRSDLPYGAGYEARLSGGGGHGRNKSAGVHIRMQR